VAIWDWELCSTSFGKLELAATGIAAAAAVLLVAVTVTAVLVDAMDAGLIAAVVAAAERSPESQKDATSYCWAAEGAPRKRWKKPKVNRACASTNAKMLPSTRDDHWHEGMYVLGCAYARNVV
jgi:hypothetical protein